MQPTASTQPRSTTVHAEARHEPLRRRAASSGRARRTTSRRKTHPADVQEWLHPQPSRRSRPRSGARPSSPALATRRRVDVQPVPGRVAGDRARRRRSTRSRRRSTILQIVFLVIALVLMLSAGVLILNTIRMAIFARRREVSVMKLVGATNWFIRDPLHRRGHDPGDHRRAARLGRRLRHPRRRRPPEQRREPPVARVPDALTGWHVFGTDVGHRPHRRGHRGVGSAFAVRRFLDV